MRCDNCAPWLVPLDDDLSRQPKEEPRTVSAERQKEYSDMTDREYLDATGERRTTGACDECGGTGTLEIDCDVCGGSGRFSPASEQRET
jgi:DnaJ-class molecular chaperone